MAPDLVVIPMAGEGKRFAQAGYTFPKPLISIRGKPMIQWVIESLNLPDAQYVFACRQEDLANYALTETLEQLVPGAEIVPIPALTEGAACTVEVAVQAYADDCSILIANCDQWIQWAPIRFFQAMDMWKADGGILTFSSVHPKWSFVVLDPSERWVRKVAEKRPISKTATVGLYAFRKLGDFRMALTQAKQEGKTQGEYYIAPLFNHLIARGGAVLAEPVEAMWGLGTPEDLEEFKLWQCR